MLKSIFATFFWDPNPDIFVVPYLNHPLKWYGLLFMGGFIAGFFVLVPIIKQLLKSSRPTSSESVLQNLAHHYVDRLTWCIVIGTIVGARLGHVFLYDWPNYRHDWMGIFKIWEGGLASHGGAIGVLLAIYFYIRSTKKNFPEINFLKLCDLACIPIALTITFIRLGNFMNQEILGMPTAMPWGVIFGHPIDNSPLVPRHPVQLYEAAAYLATFFLLFGIWKSKKERLPTGFLFGLFLICVFSARFFLEFFKSNQDSHLIDVSFLQAGQILSLPFIPLGVILIGFSLARSKNANYDTGKS